MKFQPVKTAVIGCGMISDIYLKNLKDTFSIIELVGCADQVEEKARQKAEAYDIRYMTTEEILQDPSIELILNLTYASSHFEVNKQILSAGKHCYCEKMMCITKEEAQQLDALRKKQQVLFAIAPDTFLGAGLQAARFYVDSGLIGEPIQASAVLTRGYHLIKEDKDDRVRKFSVMYEGGGIPYDMGGYYLHALFHLLGPVQSVCGYAVTRNAVRPYLNPRHSKFDEPFTVNTVNTMCASMQFRCGAFGSISISSDYQDTSNDFRICGTKGILHLGDPNNFGDQPVLEKNGEKTVLPLYHPYNANSRGIGAADMAWAIRTNRPPRLSFEMGYHALEIIHALIDCTKDGQVQYLSCDFPRPAPVGTAVLSGTAAERCLYDIS